MLSLLLSETKSLLMEELNSLYARFRRGAHTSPTEPLNAPCNRCREWHGSTRNTCVKRVDRCFFRAHRGGHGRCGTQRGRTTGFMFVQRLGQRRIPKLWFMVCAQPVLPLGEMILARRPGAHLQKSQTHFVCGCCLGRDSHTDEHTVGSKAGVFRTRAVRRLTEDRIWSAEAIADMDWTPWRTAERTRGRLRKVAVTMNVPIWNALLPTIPGAYREPSLGPTGTTPWLASRGGTEAAPDAATKSEKPGVVHERSPLRPEDESSAKQPRVDDPTLPDPGSTLSSLAGIPLPSTPVATSSASLDMSGAQTQVRPTKPRSPGPPLGSTTVGESPQTPLPK